MAHPSWLPPKNSNEPVGHVTARMETTHSFGTPSISISTQQTPKKFAPVVAPKPKYNPYRQPEGDGEPGVEAVSAAHSNWCPIRELCLCLVFGVVGDGQVVLSTWALQLPGLLPRQTYEELKKVECPHLLRHNARTTSGACGEEEFPLEDSFDQ
ncbi:hypothetical protein lerEdw1_005102 [Lerista edwardsae]|nr:hypothetical protein lerEdw1_005102 [Lerista edwardsae]